VSRKKRPKRLKNNISYKTLAKRTEFGTRGSRHTSNVQGQKVNSQGYYTWRSAKTWQARKR